MASRRSHAGLYMLPMAAMTLVFAPLSGRLVGRRGRTAVPLVVAGIALDGRGGDADAADGRTLAGVRCSAPTSCSGSASAWSTRRSPTRPSPGCLPPRRESPRRSPRPAGRSARRSASRSLGAVAGAGISGEIGSSFAAATHASWWIVAGLSFAIVILGLATTTRWAQQTAVETADRFREDGPQAGQPQGEAVAGQAQDVPTDAGLSRPDVPAQGRVFARSKPSPYRPNPAELDPPNRRISRAGNYGIRHG